MIPTAIDKKDLILVKDIPKGTGKVVAVTYLGKTLVVSIESYESGRYRMDFIQKFGIPLPKPPAIIPEVFSPNILELIGGDIGTIS